ncbi:DUF5947 family protein [Streptosporangium sp. NPDC051022]|uniref:DUF5947 family protein n=1 Tax=Streptosporangium sp. NPDC051022 TaxID=3155752 RepID=UPI003438ADF7
MTTTGLRRFRRPSGPPETAERARCELCGEQAGAGHGHVAHTGNRALLCACRPCYLLFTHDGAARTVRDGAAERRYRAVPDRYLCVPSFRMTSADWDDLQIPVRTAFFFHNSALGRTVAFYPSPAGATESLLPLGTWERVVEANPMLADAHPDVEALLVDRHPEGDFTCHLVPIDACYELVGLVRLRWKGFGGGQELRDAVDAFLDGLGRRGHAMYEGEDGGGE